MNFFRKYLFVCFSPDGAGSTSGPSAPAGGGSPTVAGGTGAPPPTGAPGRDGATGAGAGSQPGSGAPPEWKAPDYLPEHLRGSDVGQTFDRVAADWKAQRDRIAALPALPKSVDEYQFVPSDKVKPWLGGDLGKDPAFATAREAALKAGVPAAVFNQFVGSFYEGLVDGKLIPQPWSAARERDALIGGAAATMTEDQKTAALEPVIKPLAEFLDGLSVTKELSKEGHAALAGLLDTATGVRALQTLVNLAKKTAPGLVPGGRPGGMGTVSHSDLKVRQRDPRGQPGGREFDPAFYAETQRLYQEAFK